MKGNLDININSFAENFYTDSLEREILFNEIFKNLESNKWLKSVQHTYISKSKLLTFALFSFETILKSLYILSHCHSYDEESVRTIYNKLFSFWHHIDKIYGKLPKDWKILSDDEYEILNRYSKNWVSIRYNLDAYYRFNIYDRHHSWDSYLKDDIEKEIIKENKLKKLDPLYQKNLNELKFKYKLSKLEEIDNALKMFGVIIQKLKSLYIDKWCRKVYYNELKKEKIVESISNLWPYVELVNWISMTSIPKNTHLVMQNVIDNNPKYSNILTKIKMFLKKII